MELKLAVAISVLALVSVAISPAPPSNYAVGTCVGFAATSWHVHFGSIFAGLLVFLVVGSMTIHHLTDIQAFLLGIIGYAGRSTRRLIALGLLLLFLLTMLYLAEVTTRQLILLRSAVVVGLPAIAFALWLLLSLDLWFVTGLADVVRRNRFVRTAYQGTQIVYGHLAQDKTISGRLIAEARSLVAPVRRIALTIWSCVETGRTQANLALPEAMEGVARP